MRKHSLRRYFSLGMTFGRHNSSGEQIVSGHNVVTSTAETAPMIGKVSGPDVLRMHALLLTADEEIRKIFNTLFSNLKLVTEYCDNEAEALTQIFTHKFETVVLDFDTFRGTLPSREKLQQNRANKNLVVFAIATGEAKRAATEYGANFIFDRPVEPARIAQVLRTAYGLMLRDRREYFRLAVALCVSVRRISGEILDCKTINVSRNGMALSTPSAFQVGEDVELNLRVDEIALSLLGIGKIIWDDQHGKAGIFFECKKPEQYAPFSSWIDNRFYLQFDLVKNS